VKASVAGKDYPEGKVFANEPPYPRLDDCARIPALPAEWRKRPEYRAAGGKKAD
jgi:hypothetical protein